MKELKVGVIRISNSCTLNDTVDEVGIEIMEMINEGILGKSRVVKMCTVQEDQGEIREKVRTWIQNQMDLILTVGGTRCNLSKNAILPELQVEARGILELMRKIPFDEAGNVTCGVSGKTIIANLPDDKETSKRCLRLSAQGIASTIFLLNTASRD